jgi:hypothetical protein
MVRTDDTYRTRGDVYSLLATAHRHNSQGKRAPPAKVALKFVASELPYVAAPAKASSAEA